ncbi:hybrid sensor histidine kinase/response regulator [Synechocystis salina LEGE 06155]|nr:hybrid sensor histidine kinase/response regulator [Synechocystis salina LEGE 06155]
MTLPRILIVDDEPINFDVIESILSEKEFVLHYASSGERAIAALPDIDPDLILLDVMMPGLDGLETCHQIKSQSQWKLLPIIMVTALDGEENLARCLNTGADDYISKPVRSLELQARIKSLLRIKQQQERIEEFALFQRDTIRFLGGSLKELRGGLVSMFPHELNTPLNGIINGLQLLQLEPDFNPSGSPQVNDLLNIALESSLRMDRIVKQFLHYLYLVTNKNKLTHEQTELQLELLKSDEKLAHTSLINEIAEVKAQLHNREMDLICDVVEYTLPVKAFYLHWSVSEIIENAFKFSKPGTPVVVEGKLENGAFHLRVQDQGKGMTSAQIKGIDAFVQYERRNYEQQGMGLGLKITQLVMDEIQGSINISSNSHNTTVDIHIPLSVESN